MEVREQKAYPASKRYLGAESSMIVVQLTRQRNVGGNFSDEIFEEPVLRQRSTQREERTSNGLLTLLGQ